MPTSPPTGLRLALELTDFGARMREQRFRREHPDADEAAIRSFMNDWWLDRPGAPDGDAVGRVVSFPRG